MEHLSWPQNCEAIFQPQNAGHISPRNLVKAQKVLAGKNNCQIISDALVTKITKPGENCNGFYSIICKRQNYEKEVRYFLPCLSKATLAPLLIANSFESGPRPTPCADKMPLHQRIKWVFPKPYEICFGRSTRFFVGDSTTL